MDKLQMAHEYALVRLTCSNPKTLDEIISLSWYYADAMQAEAEKRESKERPDVLKEEWQPDWSQAPEWAKAWTFDRNAALWWSEIPEMHRTLWFIDGGVWQCADAPSFDYQGNWKESLRKRPQ